MRVLLIEDHPLFRLGVRELIRKRWHDAVVLEAETMEGAKTLLDGPAPDIIILDLSLPDTAGSEGPARALEMAPGIPILVVSTSNESQFAARLLKMGVSGYVAKDRASGVLSHAIARVVAGGRYVTPELAECLVGLMETESASTLPHELLTDQEYRVMLLIAAGKGPTEIAKSMSLSVKTVGTYRARILMKAEWKNNTELTKYCVQHKLTDSIWQIASNGR